MIRVARIKPLVCSVTRNTRGGISSSEVVYRYASELTSVDSGGDSYHHGCDENLALIKF